MVGLIAPVLLGGPPGQPGTGELVFPFVVGPELAGSVLVQQAFVLDPGAPSSIAATNALRMAYGT